MWLSGRSALPPLSGGRTGGTDMVPDGFDVHDGITFGVRNIPERSGRGRTACPPALDRWTSSAFMWDVRARQAAPLARSPSACHRCAPPRSGPAASFPRPSARRPDFAAGHRRGAWEGDSARRSAYVRFHSFGSLQQS
ncbi:hypothetical protein AvCA_46490 [Azotobacter vinelandii CA]|uniref:Uncharacterized protein n=2 Tax=Azotobacter vinelandii TaxID=354 RepID=C1DIT5_AZOVD|nr:hypothetical protein Avin_46490 [Azotobacter vinelandii DJ]AGK15894.1 hypothetical protein AvCA_46490 [Azotobacter vinelandii CA]AGK22132.1 hypothetical protein AvCA6_46490 [Azotobacter vinelandii CA6]